jgi:hypothetical protein
MTAQVARISKTVSYTVDEWAEVESFLAERSLEFSPFAKAAIAEKMEREEKKR